MSDQGSNRLPVLADTVRRAHAGSLESAKTAATFAMEAGAALIEAKALMKHGQWLPWLKKHCGLSPRSAQGYMQLARAGNGEDAQRVAHLPIREALKVIAESREQANLPPPKGATSEELWAWADRQINGPFNLFDLDTPSQLISKIARRAEIPTIPAFLLCATTISQNINLLRMVFLEDLGKAGDALGPWVDEDIDSGHLDPSGMTFLEEEQLKANIQIAATWLLGRILNEMEYRIAHFKGEDAYDAWLAEAKAMADSWRSELEATKPADLVAAAKEESLFAAAEKQG